MGRKEKATFEREIPQHLLAQKGQRDAFGLGGLRRMMLMLLAVHLRDLLKGGPLGIAAREWIDPPPPPSTLQHRITFADCAFLLGGASRVESIRQRALEDTETLLHAIEYELDTMNMAYGHVSDKDVEEDPTPTGMFRAVPPGVIHHVVDGWK